jgi:hypothetical protein
VLTAAHVVIGSTTVVVSTGDQTTAGTVVRLDPTRDLAIVAVAGISRPAVALTRLLPGATGIVVGGNLEGSVDATIERRVLMTVDEVRGSQTHERHGYELDARVEAGDSGSGLYGPLNRLAGIVFAVPRSGRSATFAVGADEIRVIVDSLTDAAYRCDPSLSRLVPIE